MKTNAVFYRKEINFDTSPCTIEKIIELSEDQYARFAQNMLRDHDFISENNDLMYQDDKGNHCLLILGKDCDDGILVESEGNDYARYSAFIPHARDFVNTQIRKMADKMVKDGTELTESGSWTMEFDDIRKHFDTTVTNTNGIGQLLLKELREREEVAECIMTEDSIEMTYHLEHCSQCQQGGIEGARSLYSLMGCNLEDVHLVDSEEEHDLATVVELNQNTLTDEGKAEWSDVLSAQVCRIYEGSYGLQIELSGCSSDRLCEFSFMLAGQCSAEDYDRFINKSEPEQTMAME